jgi:hypothetical protein
VREVIELGAIHLHRVAYALDPVKQDVDGNASSARETLTALGEQHDELLERMKVRLGPEHEVTRKFMGAVGAELEIFRALGGLRRALAHVERDELAYRQLEGPMDTYRATISEARERFDVHRTDFIAIAARTAGARLPSR